MPEGPSIFILKESLYQFKGKQIISISGNSKIDQHRLLNKHVLDFRSWGKHLLICFDDFTVKFHLLMFGSYTINDEKDRAPRLLITFPNGYVNFYSCSVTILEGYVDTLYDFSSDVMDDSWDEVKALDKLKQLPNTMICDALLEQDIFAGVGNIIKNETLFRVKVHPESTVGNIPISLQQGIITEARNYSFDFLKWRRKFELKKHYLIYNQKLCHTCNGPITRKNTGIKNRRSFFCPNCQQKCYSQLIVPT